MKWKFEKIKRDFRIKLEVESNQIIGYFKISGETYRAYLSKPYYSKSPYSSEFMVYNRLYINVYEKYVTVLLTRENLLKMIKNYEMETCKRN